MRDVLSDIRERVKTAKDEGKTLEAVKEMGLTKEWDETRGQGFINAEKIVEFVYNSLP